MLSARISDQAMITYVARDAARRGAAGRDAAGRDAAGSAAAGRDAAGSAADGRAQQLTAVCTLVSVAEMLATDARHRRGAAGSCAASDDVTDADWVRAMVLAITTLSMLSIALDSRRDTAARQLRHRIGSTVLLAVVAVAEVLSDPSPTVSRTEHTVYGLLLLAVLAVADPRGARRRAQRCSSGTRR